MSRRSSDREWNRFAIPRAGEWLGGRFTLPVFVEDREPHYHPDVVLWKEAGDGPIVAQRIVDPQDADAAVAQALVRAFESPFVGPPRQPTRIRVADAAIAAEIRTALRARKLSIPVRAAPTPELDATFAELCEHLSAAGAAASYLEGGLVSARAMGELFTAAEILHGLAPWKVAADDQVLRMDIPALGVDGACLSIIGNLGESFGVVIFPSLEGYEAFLAASDHRVDRRGHLDLGRDHLVLGFQCAADLPARMQREVSEHEWPVAGADAYPVLDHRERDGAPLPLTEREVRIASACATSLATFFALHRDLFLAEELEPVSESYFDGDELEVRLTFPYEAFPDFDFEDGAASSGAAAEVPPRRKVGRNEPCPCGSGRKYKKCHLPIDEAARDAAASVASNHDLDGELVRKLADFAIRRFGDEWLAFGMDFADVSETLQLAMPWSVFHYRIRGETIATWFVRERGGRLSDAERDWLAAQCAAWLSVWEVTAVEPGASVTLRDLLTDEVRRVREVSGSRSLVVRDAVLARVADGADESLICGAHPCVLPPLAAAEVVRRARGRLRRKRAVEPERLRDENFGRYLIARWEEAIAALDERTAVPPILHNTDGDLLLLTTDHFAIAPGAEAEVGRRLAGMKGVEEDEPEGSSRVYVFVRDGNAMHAGWENTVVGRARLSADSLQLETNSRERADALSERVEVACGERIRHRARGHSDPLSASTERAPRTRPVEPASPEVVERLLAFKRRHYAGWIDQALPALGGLSPRAAVRTAGGRSGVDALLKDIENRERRCYGAAAFDFAPVRRELGLE